MNSALDSKVHKTCLEQLLRHMSDTQVYEYCSWKMQSVSLITFSQYSNDVDVFIRVTGQLPVHVKSRSFGGISTSFITISGATKLHIRYKRRIQVSIFVAI